MVFLDTVTHVAGPTVVIGDRLIQRCMVCGEKLWDETSTDKSDFLTRCCHWTEGHLVHCSDHGMEQSDCLLDLKSQDDLPQDFCLALVEM